MVYLSLILLFHLLFFHIIFNQITEFFLYIVFYRNTVNITNIYCPGYSGSTILGTLLGCNANIFFGGEINHLYTNKSYNNLTKHDFNAKLCSNHINCDYFDDLIETFKVNEKLDKIKKYLEFIENKNIKNLVIQPKLYTIQEYQ